MISTSHNGDRATFGVTLWLSIKKFSYLLPVQYNITFSVRFFCPRLIKIRRLYASSWSYIFYYNFCARHTSSKYFGISKLDEIFDLEQILKVQKIGNQLALSQSHSHYLRTSFPIPSGQIPVPVTPIPFSQPKNRPIPAPILPLHDPYSTS